MYKLSLLITELLLNISFKWYHSILYAAFDTIPLLCPTLNENFMIPNDFFRMSKMQIIHRE